MNAHNRPDVVFGSVSERLDEMISSYVSKSLDPSAAFSEERLPSHNFQNMCYYRALRSLAEPGENVGLLAAQVSFSLVCQIVLI